MIDSQRGAYTYHVGRAQYNGSYTMATKPIKFLELHYTMTQFLIIVHIELKELNHFMYFLCQTVTVILDL